MTNMYATQTTRSSRWMHCSRATYPSCTCPWWSCWTTTASDWSLKQHCQSIARPLCMALTMVRITISRVTCPPLTLRRLQDTARRRRWDALLGQDSRATTGPQSTSSQGTAVRSCETALAARTCSESSTDHAESAGQSQLSLPQEKHPALFELEGPSLLWRWAHRSQSHGQASAQQRHE